MTRSEFLASLEGALSALPQADREDIILDYKDHFNSGMEQGMTEEEVAAKLGSPADIAAQYLENLPEEMKAISDGNTSLALPELSSPAAEEKASETDKGCRACSENCCSTTCTNGGRVVANVFFWIFAVGSIIALIWAWIAILFSVIGIFIGAGVLVIAAVPSFTVSVAAAIGLIFIAVGLVFLAVIGITGLKYSMFGLKQLIRLYKRVSNKILGRSNA